MNLRPGVEARNTALLEEPADREDGRLISQNNHLILVWMQILLWIRDGGDEETSKKPLIIQISPRIASLRQGAVC